MQTARLQPDAAGLEQATELLNKGELVAFPTETVYGLGADARQAEAVAGIYAAKGRPSYNPLIVHVPTLQAAWQIGAWSETAELLAQSFWPGPLTLVLELAPNHGLCDAVTAGLQTVAIRVPGHPVAQALLHGFGGPIAAPSANPSGRVSATTADHVLDGLDGRIAAVLDGGACPVGVESTIIGLRGDRVELLREGGLSQEILVNLLGEPLVLPEDGDTISAPGQLKSHYAPKAALRLNATSATADEVLLGFGPMTCDVNLSEAGDLEEAAARLFACLRSLDTKGCPIAVAPIPDIGIGRAINDRLDRAAAPRP